MKRTLALFLALMMCVLSFASCGGDGDTSTASEESKAPATSTESTASTESDASTDAGETAYAGWDYIVNNGKIVVGLDDTFAPMGFRDEANNLVGFDIDLAKAVGEILGVTVEFKPIDWNSKEMELSSKKIDCIWNGMSATAERQASMSLTNKYLNNRIVIMTLNADVKIASIEDLANYRVGTQAGSAALDAIKANEAYYNANQDNITEYPTYDEAILDMETGRIDCIVVDEVLGEYKNSKRESKLTLCEYNFGDDFYAIGCRKEDTGVSAKINEAIATLIENGKAAEISNNWFGKNIVINEGYDK
jgi:polar amino acid transport system substrate-binding protein